MDINAINFAVRPGKINVLHEADGALLSFCKTCRAQALGTDLNDLAWFHITDKFRPDNIKSAVFRSDDPALPKAAERQRHHAQRIADGIELIPSQNDITERADKTLQ